MALTANYEVAEDPVVGRCLRTTRALEEGELIVEEEAIVHGPSRESDMVCLGCYSSLSTGSDEDDSCINVCMFCGLPFCPNDQCQLSDQHRPECDAIQKVGRSKSIALLDDSAFLYEVVLVLRCLHLRHESPESWESLLSLQSHSADRQEDEDTCNRMEKIFAYLDQELTIPDITLELINEVCGILDVNSFEVPTYSGTIQAVYRTVCLTQHNCIPSSHRTFSPSFSITLRAAVPLAQGASISITYTDSLWTTQDRREQLKASKFFSCTCERCSDPEELGTKLSALVCPRCHIGTLLPEDPLNEAAPWACQDCLQTFEPSYQKEVCARVSQTIAFLETNMDGLDPVKCEEFIMVHSRLLGASHAHMLDIKHSMLHLLGQSEGFLLTDLSDKQLVTREEICRLLISVADKILPGISRLKGTTQYQLYLTYQQRGLNWLRSGYKSKKDVRAVFQAAHSSLERCLHILRFEPPHRPEGKLVIQAKEELQMLTEFMRCSL